MSNERDDMKIKVGDTFSQGDIVAKITRIERSGPYLPTDSNRAQCRHGPMKRT